MSEIYNFYKNLLLQNRSVLKNMIRWAVLWLFLGVICYILFPSIGPRILDFFQRISGDILGQHSKLYIFVYIFFNNARAALISIFLGAILGIVPLFTIAANSFILGSLATHLIYKAGGYGLVAFIVLVVPHGILEIPALFLAASFGYRLGIFWKIDAPGLSLGQKWLLSFKRSIFITPLIIFLLLGAAFIEAFVTMSFLSILPSLK